MTILLFIMEYNTDNKKRKYAEYEDGNNSSNNNDTKPKLFSDENKMIYAIDTEIHFTAPINKENIETIIKKITKIIKDNHKKYDGGDEKLTITYIVDSPGGCVMSILKFVDFLTIVRVKYPYVEFVSVATGLIASAGTIMSVVADKRLMTKNAYAMIHELSSSTGGQYTKMLSYSKHLTSVHNKLIDIYFQNCKKMVTVDELEQLLQNETWYTAGDYLKIGLIDEIC